MERYRGTIASAPPIDDLIQIEKPHVVVLEVCTQALGTNGRPPRVRVYIVDALHGALPPGERDAVFPPDNQLRFFAHRGGGDDRLEQWNAEPCGTPATGEACDRRGHIRERRRALRVGALRPAGCRVGTSPPARAPRGGGMTLSHGHPLEPHERADASLQADQGARPEGGAPRHAGRTREEMMANKVRFRAVLTP